MASRAPPQHVALLGLLEDQDKLIDAVDLILDALDKGSKGIGNVINERVRDPIRGDADVVLQLLNTPSYILRMWCRAEVEL